ncbi:MAG: hypothetical protein U0984_06185 [Prosthecobacter sp.]|nr:hypothetical protein [Prosthecobacter sp.]
MKRHRFAISALLLWSVAIAAHGADLKLTLQSRVEGKGESKATTKPAAWDCAKTAIIVCDMWDLHHCKNAVGREQEMAPRMNDVLEKARGQGVLIIHAPSSCMAPYENHPGRVRAKAAPKAANLPADIANWCKKIPAEDKVQYPLDQTDGGEDDNAEEHKLWAEQLAAKGLNPRRPWTRQIDVLKIHDTDAISDSGVEIWNLLEQRGITNVILMGVHLNMCVSGRPFGLRQMAQNGKQVALMRDMTDTMYNPARWPYVTHHRGTALFVEYVEKVICPTITSDQILGGNPFAFKGAETSSPSPEITALLAHPIIDPNLPLTEVQDFTEARVPLMPKVKSLTEWQTFADKTRADVLDKIVFRGDAGRQWRDAKTQVEWLDAIPGGPGYQIKKLRYEALPGLWIPALLYEPDHHEGRIPVYLAVNGHDAVGKAAPYKQIRCINLAKRGIACLNVEWLGMGQLRTDGFTHYRMNQIDLCGASGLAPFYLAMSRGLDILLALPYADSKRVGVSGLSGGGWQTIIISSLDTRVTLCNPVAGYSSFRTRARFPTDLGDSEQTPNDLATVADYAHLTAMLAGRAALLTFNVKDNCCFASDHALAPLQEAAEPMFALYGQAARLRTHVNYDPGTHNYEVDNRQAFYSIVGAEFFPNNKQYNAKEIPAESEVKTAEQLNVPMPAENRDFHALASELSRTLPHEFKLGADAARAKLADLVKFKAGAVTAREMGTETRGDVKATFWKLRIDDTWTVPAVELVRGEPKGTVLLVSDNGRKSATSQVEALLAAGQRVLAIDPFYFGESKIAQRDYLYALLVAAVGDRPLGIQATQVAGAARWAQEQFKGGPVAVQAIGPRSSTFAMVATALETRAISKARLGQAIGSFREVIDGNWTVMDKPEFFCFGLFEAFDIPQIKQLAGAARVQ